MTEMLNRLRVWAVIQTNHVRLTVKDAPDYLRSDRIHQARQFAHFVREAVWPMVSDQSTDLATALLALQTECDRTPETPQQCRECPGAAATAALASALANWIRGGAR